MTDSRKRQTSDLHAFPDGGSDNRLKELAAKDWRAMLPAIDAYLEMFNGYPPSLLLKKTIRAGYDCRFTT